MSSLVLPRYVGVDLCWEPIKFLLSVTKRNSVLTTILCLLQLVIQETASVLCPPIGLLLQLYFSIFIQQHLRCFQGKFYEVMDAHTRAPGGVDTCRYVHTYPCAHIVFPSPWIFYRRDCGDNNWVDLF